MKNCDTCGVEMRLDESGMLTPWEPPIQYLLQNCSAGFIGNAPVFWQEGGSGYTQWIDEAKRWTKKEADQQIESTRGSHNWQMWTVAEIESAAKRTVDIQDLRKLVDV